MKCSSACPFYTDEGVVRGFNGSLKTHCRMTMHPWMVDCDHYNPNCIDKVTVTEDQWKMMLKAVHKRAIRQRKLYPEDHENANEVGCEWTRARNTRKSDKVKPLQLKSNL